MAVNGLRLLLFMGSISVTAAFCDMSFADIYRAECSCNSAICARHKPISRRDSCAEVRRECRDWTSGHGVTSECVTIPDPPPPLFLGGPPEMPREIVIGQVIESRFGPDVPEHQVYRFTSKIKGNIEVTVSRLAQSPTNPLAHENIAYRFYLKGADPGNYSLITHDDTPKLQVEPNKTYDLWLQQWTGPTPFELVFREFPM